MLLAATEADALNLDISLATWAILGGVIVAMLVFGAPEAAMEASAAALEQGVFAQAIRPPTVPEGTSRLRLVATAAHTDLPLYENVMKDLGYAVRRREVVPTGDVRQHGR